MKKTLFYGASASALCLGACAGAALASAATGAPVMPLADITLPTGAWMTQFGSAAVEVVATAGIALVTWASNKFLHVKIDESYSNYIKGMETSVLQAAWNKLQEATPDQVVIPTKNELLNEGAKIVLETEGPRLIKWFGGVDGIKKWLEGYIALVPAIDLAPAAAPVALK